MIPELELLDAAYADPMIREEQTDTRHDVWLIVRHIRRRSIEAFGPLDLSFMVSRAAAVHALVLEANRAVAKEWHG